MLGRFLQTDPIGYADDNNLYAYVGNGPVNRKDPLGLTKQGAILLACQMCDGVLNGVKGWWNSSVAAAQSESFSDGMTRILQGLNPEVGAGVAMVGSIGKNANALGRTAELAVDAAYDIGPKTPFVVNGRNRIADGINILEGTISEVKNVVYQYYSTQLKDCVTYAQDAGLQFNLYVSENTIISPQLENAINDGLINLRITPKSP